MGLMVRTISFLFWSSIVFAIEISDNELEWIVQRVLKEQQHDRKVAALEKELNVIKTEMESLREVQFQTQTELNMMKTKLKNTLDQIKERDDENAKLVKENNYLLKIVDDVKSIKKYRNGSENSFEDNHHIKRISNPGMMVGSPIAFSGYMTSNIANPHDNEIFLFDHVIVNSGNGYNKHNGMFTAPVKGIYAFFGTVLTFSGKSLESEIVQNGNGICRIYSGDDSFDGSGSNMAIIQLEVGDVVWMRIHDRFHDTGVSVDGPWTTFSGFLLYEME
ncbi:heavy metal-binding protein HIP-like [Saccostrea echinata]|uniref:heavy metal-binding protein HIP-like n=1 Tax=Saccostrea echinata TaxID=191078 RepID=UPI002A82D7C0|nr:heavy metal-binding protein HIP-like [Saccostrea echinata]